MKKSGSFNGFFEIELEGSGMNRRGIENVKLRNHLIQHLPQRRWDQVSCSNPAQN